MKPLHQYQLLSWHSTFPQPFRPLLSTRTQHGPSNRWLFARSLSKSEVRYLQNGTSGYAITLDPKRLAPAHFINLSRTSVLPWRRSVLIRPEGAPQASNRKRSFYSLNCPGGRFPPDCGGFFYYHLDPGAPPLSAEIRFRLTRSSDPRLFASSPDLTTAWGLPWRIPLMNILTTHATESLWPILLADNLVEPGLVTAAEQLAGPVLGSATRLLHAFGQPFLLPLDTTGASFWAIGHSRSAHATFRSRFSLSPTRDSYGMPLTGCAICCFEKSSLPEHAGKRAVVIRVLRPVNVVREGGGKRRLRLAGVTMTKSPNALQPRGGELLYARWETRTALWSVDMDAARNRRRSVTNAFEILHENEAHAVLTETSKKPRQ